MYADKKTKIQINNTKLEEWYAIKLGREAKRDRKKI